MPSLKKITLILAVALGIAMMGALFILPYGLGFVAKTKYTQLLNTLPKAGQVQMALLGYHRGWFSSEATLKITVSAPSSLATLSDGAPVLVPLLVKQHIEHGPVISLALAADKKNLVFGQTLITSRLDSGYGVLEMVSWIKLNGTVWGMVNVPKLHVVNQRTARSLMASDIKGIFKLSSDLQQFMASLSIPALSIRVGNSQQDIQQVGLYYDLQKSASGLFLGKHIFTMGSMVWNTSTYTTPLRLVDMRVQASDEEKNHKINNELNMQLKQFIFHNASYGPQRLNLAVNQLDTLSFLALAKQLKQSEFARGGVGVDELTKDQQLVRDLLSKGLNIQLKRLELVTPWGSPSLMASLALPAQSASTDDLSKLMANMNLRVKLNTPATLLMYTLSKFNAAVQADKALLEQEDSASIEEITQQQIASWVEKKWLLPSGNGYYMNLLYHNGRMIMNGESLYPTSDLFDNTNTVCKNAQTLS